jgi:peptidoglycan/xylan/chitin deacetylase (PgdA/CDA1 family)
MSNSKGKYVNRCLITFDDGYKNQLEVAAKILNHHNLQGIFFVSFQSVSTGQALTIDKVMMWMSYIPAGNYRLMGNVIEINDSNRCANASRLYEQLLKDYKLWDVIENELNNAFSFDSLPINSEYARLRFKPFDFNDLKILAEKGHLVGSHSWNHIPLSILPAEKQKEDFSLCVHFANKYCNSMLYSYPFGGIQEVSPATTTLCQEYGFSAAYLNIPEPPQWLNVNKNYILSRINLPNEKNKYLLDAKLSGFESFCKKASKKIRFIVDNITCHFQLSQKA